jgi:hypothetical protein
MERPVTTQTSDRDRPARSLAVARRILAVVEAAPPILAVAAAGYAVVGLFALVYGIVRWGWPDLTQAFSVTIAALAAAPLALALLWNRLGGFKAFGFEITLTPPSAQMEPEVAAVVGEITEDQSFNSDSLPYIVEGITQAIARPEQEVLELNLRDGNYWWSTRLFLLAALVEDYSRIQRLVFVEGGEERTFVGMAPPADVRRALALATDWPILEQAYQNLRKNPPSTPGSELSRIVLGWSTYQFKQTWQVAPDEDLRVKVDTTSLRRWLALIGKRLTTENSVEWHGITRRYLVRALLFQFDSPYVALLRQGRLDRIVNRLDLALRLAKRAVG